MLIGLSGVAGAGKDTVANYLVKNYGFRRYAFADAVRDVALAINPYVPIAVYDLETPETYWPRLSDVIEESGWDHAKRTVPEVRRLLQVIGTEAGRMLVGTNVWVDILESKLQADGWPNAVITDFRFPNEDKFIRDNIGVTVKIIRDNNPDAIAATHASEQYSPDCDFTLLNQNSLEDLYASVDELMGQQLIKAPR